MSPHTPPSLFILPAGVLQQLREEGVITGWRDELYPDVTSHPSLFILPAGVLQQLREEGVITGWRDELYPVTSGFYASPVMLIERAAATHFGIKAYGVHINGYVKVGVLGMHFTLWHHTLGSKRTVCTSCTSSDTSRWGKVNSVGLGGE